MTAQSKLSVCQVKLTPIPLTPSGELSDTVFRKCCFCGKTCLISPVQLSVIQKLSGPEGFFCSFCLRHHLNSKNGKDFLILSFRSIIGYLYFQNYLYATSQNKIWISEIEDYITSHKEAGLVNPVFLYDKETMLWFVNFAKVGNSRKKIPLDEVLKTVISILATFNLSSNFPEISTSALYGKYKDAIAHFYERRHRPDSKRMLIPTLTGCGLHDPKNFSFDHTRNFILEDLQMKK